MYNKNGFFFKKSNDKYLIARDEAMKLTTRKTGLYGCPMSGIGLL